MSMIKIFFFIFSVAPVDVTALRKYLKQNIIINLNFIFINDLFNYTVS